MTAELFTNLQALGPEKLDLCNTGQTLTAKTVDKHKAILPQDPIAPSLSVFQIPDFDTSEVGLMEDAIAAKPFNCLAQQCVGPAPTPLQEVTTQAARAYGHLFFHVDGA